MAGSDIYTGTLDLLILRAVSLRPMHGYAIAQWVRSHTADVLTLNEGSLYPALHRLAAREWLAEEWRTSENNREARFYELTPAGRKHLAAETRRWHRYVGAVNAALSARGL
jgi:PadR family transcriptional regulator PadR